MTKSQYRTNLTAIKNNLRNAVYLTALIADDANLTTNGIIDIKSLNLIIDSVGQFSKDFIEIQENLIVIRTKLEAVDAN